MNCLQSVAWRVQSFPGWDRIKAYPVDINKGAHTRVRFEGWWPPGLQFEGCGVTTTIKNFYAKRLKKVLFEQLKKMIRKSGGVEPPFQNSGGVATPPPNPPLFGARGQPRPSQYANHYFLNNYVICQNYNDVISNRLQ